MNHNGKPDPHNLESYCGYLLFVARANWHPGLSSTMGPEDVVQEVMFKAQKNMDDFRGRPEQFKGWLRTILIHVILDEIAKLPRNEVTQITSDRLMQQIPGDGTTPSEAARKAENARRLEDALAKLPDRQHEAVFLRFYHQFAVKEIARHMKITIGAATGLLRSGLDNLADHLKESE